MCEWWTHLARVLEAVQQCSNAGVYAQTSIMIDNLLWTRLMQAMQIIRVRLDHALLWNCLILARACLCTNAASSFPDELCTASAALSLRYKVTDHTPNTRPAIWSSVHSGAASAIWTCTVPPPHTRVLT